MHTSDNEAPRGRTGSTMPSFSSVCVTVE